MTTTYHHSDNAEKYRSNASFVFNDENTLEVLKLLDPQPGEVILDVGCGTGELSKKIHAIVNIPDQEGCKGCVYGIDTASSMIAAAQENSAAYGLRYAICDGHDLLSWLKHNNLVGKFDKVFSNAALHWMKQSPLTVAQGMSAALKPSGILAIEMGGHLNCIGVRSCLHSCLQKRGIDASKVDPWFFPTPASYSKILQEAGLHSTVTILYPRPTLLPMESGLSGWLENFAGPFINVLPEADRRGLLQEVEEQVKVDMYDQDTKQWTLMYVRTRVQAIKQ